MHASVATTTDSWEGLRFQAAWNRGDGGRLAEEEERARQVLLRRVCEVHPYDTGPQTGSSRFEQTR